MYTYIKSTARRLVTGETNVEIITMYIDPTLFSAIFYPIELNRLNN